MAASELDVTRMTAADWAAVEDFQLESVLKSCGANIALLNVRYRELDEKRQTFEIGTAEYCRVKDDQAAVQRMITNIRTVATTCQTRLRSLPTLGGPV